MPGYIIATLNSIKDPETFASYQSLQALSSLSTVADSY